MHIYYHADLDGLTSAVVLADYLQARYMEPSSYIPIDHDRLRIWQSERLLSPAAVLDFEFHPDAVYWFDHHSTPPNVPIANGSTWAHDPSYKSCCSLVSDYLRIRFSYCQPEFGDMIRASD